jgi:hypothetical protein
MRNFTIQTSDKGKVTYIDINNNSWSAHLHNQDDIVKMSELLIANGLRSNQNPDMNRVNKLVADKKQLDLKLANKPVKVKKAKKVRVQSPEQTPLQQMITRISFINDYYTSEMTRLATDLLQEIQSLSDGLVNGVASSILKNKKASDKQLFIVAKFAIENNIK